jgi:hypothetical protein
MPYIVASAKYPSHIAKEVGKKYLEALQKFPLGSGPGEAIVPAATRGTKEGVQVFSVTQVKEEEFIEAWRRIGNMLALFLELEGFEYTMEFWIETQDALELVGMKLP